MTTYHRHQTIEARRWVPATPRNAAAGERAWQRIVAWVKASGGEARYEHDDSPSKDAPLNRIAVRGDGGWYYAYPGDYVIREATTFEAFTKGDPGGMPRVLRRFRVMSPEEFADEGWQQ